MVTVTKSLVTVTNGSFGGLGEDDGEVIFVAIPAEIVEDQVGTGVAVEVDDAGTDDPIGISIPGLERDLLRGVVGKPGPFTPREDPESIGARAEYEVQKPVPVHIPLGGSHERCANADRLLHPRQDGNLELPAIVGAKGE